MTPRAPDPLPDSPCGHSLRGQYVSDAAAMLAVLAQALERCTCAPVLHAFDADGQPALAVLHDAGCVRLGELKAGLS